jgi:hypothetical protein
MASKGPPSDEILKQEGVREQISSNNQQHSSTRPENASMKKLHLQDRADDDSQIVHAVWIDLCSPPED